MKTMTNLLSRSKRAALLATLVALSIAPCVYAQNESVLARAQARGVLRVANTQASPPWSLLDAGNKPAGYDVDVANELARRIGIAKVEFTADTFKNFVEALKVDKYDIVISNLTPTSERKLQIDFSHPYIAVGLQTFVRANEEAIKSKADLGGKRVGVSAGTTNEKWVRDNVPTAEVRTYDNSILALSDLAFGRIDAAVFSRFVGLTIAEKNGLKIKPAGDALNLEFNAMGFKKGQSDLQSAANKVIADMIADGTLLKISQKWLGGYNMPAALANAPK